MTAGIPHQVITQVELAIRGAFEHDELWRATRPMGDLHDHVTHSSFAVEVTELVEWTGKRNLTLEMLDNLIEAVPGNKALQDARVEYAAAEQKALEEGPPASAALAGYAESRDRSAGSDADAAKQGSSAPPWAWMAVGALVLVLGAVFYFATQDSGSDDALLDEWYDSCAAGDMDACDLLYDSTPIGSEYNDFGDTCGGRLPEGAIESCFDDLGP